MADPETIAEAFTAAAVKHLGAPVTISNLNPLTGGSSSE